MVNGVFSKEESVDSGIPQGTDLLGPYSSSFLSTTYLAISALALPSAYLETIVLYTGQYVDIEFSEIGLTLIPGHLLDLPEPPGAILQTRKNSFVFRTITEWNTFPVSRMKNLTFMTTFWLRCFDD